MARLMWASPALGKARLTRILFLVAWLPIVMVVWLTMTVVEWLTMGAAEQGRHGKGYLISSQPTPHLGSSTFK